MSRPDDHSLTPQQRSAVEKAAGRLLLEAGAYGCLPTPVDRLLAAAKLTVVEDELLDDATIRSFLHKLQNAGQAAGAKLKSALGKLFGLFDCGDRVVLIDRQVPKPKKPFVKLHEAGHGYMPHQANLYAIIYDSENTLDPYTTDLFEREANVFASEALFQRERFTEEANDENFGIGVPMRLAKTYGASQYATFRRYVEKHIQSCCLIVLDPVILKPFRGFTAPVRRIISSATFNRTFPAAALFAGVDDRHPIGFTIPVGRRMTGQRRVTLQDRNGDAHRCVIEAFDTGRQILVLVLDEGLESSLTLPGSRRFAAITASLRK